MCSSLLCCDRGARRKTCTSGACVDLVYPPVNVVMESTGSSATGDYSDGVYSIDEKTAAQIRYNAVNNKPLPRVKRPILPTAMLVSLVLLAVFCFIGILVSGLHFDHRVKSTWSSRDCLGQSWIMVSVRICTHLIRHIPISGRSTGSQPAKVYCRRI